MTGMDDLVTWLRAQLDDDEYIARRAGDYGWQWRASDPGIYPSDESRHPGPIVGGVHGDLEDHYARHIAHFDPARVLAEVDAKRRMLDALAEDMAMKASSPEGRDWVEGYAAEAGHRMQLLALPYADRPGYRAEWRP